MTPDQIESRLDLWQGFVGGRATLINLSENHTFRIDLPSGGHAIVRAHRPGYHAHAAIVSELAWLDALRNETDLPTIRPLPGCNGELVQDLNGQGTFAVAFAFEQGQEPVESGNLPQLFSELGRFAAICHCHAERWSPPAGFVRPTWDAGAILDADGLWGDWRTSPGVTDTIRAILTRLDQRLRADLAAYGTGPDRFGLIHADMRLANLLIDGNSTRVIDFDDCGFGWFAYDFGAAVSFFEHREDVPDLREAWLEGYRPVRRFSAEDEAMLPAAVMLRRMALLAWIGSHDETELAQDQAPHFASNTAQMAELYLASG